MSPDRIGIGFGKLKLCAEVVTKNGPTKLELPIVNFAMTFNTDKQTLTIVQEVPVKCHAVSGVESVVSFSIKQE